MEKVEKAGKLERVEKGRGEKVEAEGKRRRRNLGHTAEEKCRAVLSVWTEKRKAGEVCRELGVVWGIFQQWQERAMEGMLVALQPRVMVERGVALSPRLAVLLEKKSRAGLLSGIDKRLKRLQKDIKVFPETPISTEKN